MNRRDLLTGSAMAAAVAFGWLPAMARTARKPNFVVICCDDLGYGDVGPTGGKTIPTPHLDHMAREGITLTDYYAPANVCTPSRAGLLTGRYPIRSGMARKVLLADDTEGLPLSEVTIARALKPEYASALIGKWHLGHVAPHWPPSRHGFDYFYGIPYSHDIEPLRVYEDDGRTLTDTEPDYPRLQEAFLTSAESFIDRNRSRPFFLELALSAPHLPNYPPPAFAGRSTAGAYGDAVMEVDAIVGRLLAKLKSAGLDEDTLVIFTSDNGPWFEGSAGALRQRKGGGAYDGGYRVPFIARWPGHIPRGGRSNAIAMGTDLLPTFCALAGIAPAAGVTLDGRDISGVLLHGRASPHEQLLLFEGESVVGIRTQQWKFVGGDYFRNGFISFAGRGYPQLYDMTKGDENYSLASLHPTIARDMESRLRLATEAFAPLRTVPDRPAPPPASRHVPEIWQD